MFGNPLWFRVLARGFGLVPVCWQGWAYSAAWLSTVLAPFWLLAARHQSLEALAWLALATGALVHDVWEIWTAAGRPRPARQSAEMRGVSLNCRVRD
jgi:hypothetical protein